MVERVAVGEFRELGREKGNEGETERGSKQFKKSSREGAER